MNCLWITLFINQTKFLWFLFFLARTLFTKLLPLSQKWSFSFFQWNKRKHFKLICYELTCRYRFSRIKLLLVFITNVCPRGKERKVFYPIFSMLYLSKKSCFVICTSFVLISLNTLVQYESSVFSRVYLTHTSGDNPLWSLLLNLQTSVCTCTWTWAKIVKILDFLSKSRKGM